MQLVQHSDRVFTAPDFLSMQECAELIVLAENCGFEKAGVRMASGQVRLPLIRNNERAMYESPEWVALLWQRLSAYKLPPWQGQRAVGLPKDLRFYKYQPGQRFKMHKDGPWHEGGKTSQLTMLIYLNQNFEGGETDFRDFKLTPHTGELALFVHDTWHEGAILHSGLKYVLRSDVLFE